MTNEWDPIVDQWYMHHDKGEMFRVVAIDAATGKVAIQYFDGDVEEIERDTWCELDVEAAAAPEDWTGPYDDVDHDDAGTAPPCRSGGLRAQDWRISLELQRPAAQAGLEPRAEIEQDIKEEVRLVWRIVESVGNVSWPAGLDRLH